MVAGFLVDLVIVLIALLVIITLLVFWIWTIVDCARRKFKNKTDKIVWMIVIVLFVFLGAIIYHLIVNRPNKK